MCRIIGKFNIDLLLVDNILVCKWLWSRIIIVNDILVINGNIFFMLIYVVMEWTCKCISVNVIFVQMVVFRFRFYGLIYLVVYLLFVIVDNGWIKNNSIYVRMVVFRFRGLKSGSHRLSYFVFLNFLVFCKWLEMLMNHHKTLRHFGYGLPFGRLRR